MNQKTLVPLLAIPSMAMAAGGDNMGEFLLHHSVDNRHEWQIFGSIVAIPLHVEWNVFGINLFPSLHGLMVLMAAVLCFLVLKAAARREKLLPTNRLGTAIESIVVYLRDEVVVPNLGKKDAATWFPLIATLFFFVLGMNIIGLLPGMGAASGNLAVAGTLAGMIFVVYNVMGMWHNGVFGYFKGLVPGGVPIVMVPVLFVLELLNVFSKSAAHGIRLFANMMAGHLMISTLMALIVLFTNQLGSEILGLGVVAPAVIGLTVCIFLLKILIAFLQAFVFAMLSALFIGSAVHQDH
jgi:F-type H+-transporting ATPase subunit a